MKRALLLLAVCIAAPHLFGSTITSGSIQVSGLASSMLFTISGSGFTASGSSSLGSSGLLGPFAPGASMSVNGFTAGNNFAGGSATIAGTAYPSVLWGDIDAAGPTSFSITGPSILLDAGAGTYTGTFSFTGSLCGTTGAGGSPHPCAALLPTLTGQGVVSVNIISIPGTSILQYTSATYTFIPEPANFGSVALGGIGLALIRRRRRAKSLVDFLAERGGFVTVQG